MANEDVKIKVRCYAGFRAEESPQSFFIGNRHIGVIDVIDRWLAPEHRYFKVRGDDSGIYILRYDVAEDCWEMTMFDSGLRDDTRLSST